MSTAQVIEHRSAERLPAPLPDQAGIHPEPTSTISGSAFRTNYLNPLRWWSFFVGLRTWTLVHSAQSRVTGARRT
jgi:hypothetical protein